MIKKKKKVTALIDILIEWDRQLDFLTSIGMDNRIFLMLPGTVLLKHS